MNTPKTTCRRGHPRTPENVYMYLTPDGKPKPLCKVCKDMRNYPNGPSRRNTRENQYRVDGDAAFIVLSKGREAIIDINDIEAIKGEGHWVCMPNNYVLASKSRLFLHRLVMNAMEGDAIDHINRNPLDCRKANLRFVTASQNMQNQSITNRKSISEIKNVHWDKTVGKWKVRVKHQGHTFYGGYFDCIEVAATTASEIRCRIHSHCPENSLPFNG